MRGKQAREDSTSVGARVRRGLDASRELRCGGLGSRLAALLDGVLRQLAFGANPIVEGVSRCAAALQINVISAQSDVILRGLDLGGGRLLLLRRGNDPRPSHTVLLSTTASILACREAGGHW